MRILKLAIIAAAVVVATGCTRIPTGEVGLRVDMSNQVNPTELQPGSWNQTLIGSVITFPIREIAVEVNDRHPLTADNSAMGDFDVTVVYSINPAAVSDIFSTKSKVFHDVDKHGDIQLMHRYIETLIVNAENIAVREYKSLEIADNRQKIETSIHDHIVKELANEKLDKALTISAVQIRSATPNQDILNSATQYVKSQNEIKIKENEVKLAKLESERMAALASNSGQSIAYMQAQSQMKIAEGVANGKVHTIVVPMDFKGMVNVGK
jgi:regulator of protease activity HflC (stomatin/prohibitin superfamily)